MRRQRTGTVAVLTYHRVNDERDAFFGGTPVAVFARQMEHVARHYDVVSLEEAVEAIRTGSVAGRMAVVTFDDGYRDNYSHAFPVLRTLGIPATIFLATDAIGTGRAIWHDRVFSAFRETVCTTLDDFGYGSTMFPLRNVAEKLRAQSRVLDWLRAQDEWTRLELIDRLVKRLEVADRREVPGLMLAWDEVREMHARGIAFGSHSVTHPILSRVRPERLREEIVDSKRCIEQKLGVKIQTFAYPNGRPSDFGEGTKRCLREAGYTCAVTTVAGVNGAGQDVFELRRGQPWEEDIAVFATKLHWYSRRPW